MKFVKNQITFLLAVVVAITVFLALVLPAAAEVSVYAEGAYTGDDLVVYIYADTGTDAICSAGVKLTYNNMVLTVASAEKNEAVWFMGDGSTNYPYMNPEVADGSVVFICGKLDTSAPTAGVSGDRVLLGIVTFARTDGGVAPPDPAVAEDYFGVTVGLGRGGDFANFVTVAGTELDDLVDFITVGAIVRERGDATADGTIDTRDLRALRQMIGTDNYPCFADCTGDEILDTRDIRCLRSKI